MRSLHWAVELCGSCRLRFCTQFAVQSSAAARNVHSALRAALRPSPGGAAVPAGAPPSRVSSATKRNGADKNEPWRRCRAIIRGREAGPRSAEASVPEADNWMGVVEKEDSIIDVIKLEPAVPGSSHFVYPTKARAGLTEAGIKKKKFAVFAEDVRVVPVELTRLNIPVRTTRATGDEKFEGEFDQWQLSAEDKVEIVHRSTGIVEDLDLKESTLNP